MLGNHLKTAWRNITRHRYTSILNISGLALGLASSFLIFLWIRDELGIDHFHKNGSHLYAVYEKESVDNTTTADYETSGLLPDELKRVVPEVQYATGMEEYVDRSTFQVGEKRLKFNGDAGTADFFTMFSYRLLAGDPSTALSSPESIALSRKMAAAFFGNPTEAMGKTIRYENRQDFRVTAIFDDLPASSSRKFDFLLNWKAFLAQTSIGNWEAAGPYTVIMLRPDADPALVDKKITHFLNLYRRNQPQGYSIELHLQQYGDIYLHSHFTNGKPDGGRIEYVNLFSIVALFILVIACINFMNLATARSVKRAKEIGVRKVVGARRLALIRQFMAESFLVTVVSVGIAILLLALLLPSFNALTGKQIGLPFRNPSFWLQLLSLTCTTAFVAGIYPAIFLSSFRPLAVLKSTTTPLGANTGWLRRSLVVFQFTLSILLIIGTLVVSKQVDYIQSRNIGYDKNDLIYVPVEGALSANFDYLKKEAGRSAGIESISFISDDPDYLDNNSTDISWEGKAPGRMITAAQAEVTTDFVRTMKLSLVAGRDFSTSFPSDSSAWLINETAAREMAYAHPVGRTLTMWGRKGRIIGVLRDFNFKPIHVRITPLVLGALSRPKRYGTLLVRTRPGQTQQALATLKSLCTKLNPAFPFTYEFSADAYLSSYKNEQVIRSLADGFAVLAILISCLGLLGLASFTVERRTKEISIRKVLGASVPGLFLIVCKEFLALVTIALVVATPLSWALMNNWLGNYAYRISVAWWIFALAGGIALAITLLTIGYHALRLASTNPIRSLRTE